VLCLAAAFLPWFNHCGVKKWPTKIHEIHGKFRDFEGVQLALFVTAGLSATQQFIAIQVYGGGNRSSMVMHGCRHVDQMQKY
jgi:hypothetical protein